MRANGRVVFPARELIAIPVGVVLYAVVLWWVYATLVTPTFSYLGYRYAAPDFGLEVLAVIITIAVALVLPRKMAKASSIVLWMLFVITVAPTILMAQYTSYLDPGEALVLGLVVALVFAGVSLALRGTNRPLRLHVSPTTFWVVVAVFSLVTYLLLAVTQGLSLRFVSFFDVYDVREEYASNLDGSGLLNYLVFTQANVVNPIIIARGIATRRPLWIVLGVLGELILYSGTGFKSMIFAIPAWFIVAFLFRRRGRAVDGLSLVWGAAALMVLAAAVDELADSSIATSLLSRRFIITPGVFTSVYTAFFSSHPQVHLGHSILRPWVDYPYNQTPPHVIGDWMAGLPTMAANANLFADGFANFGWAGVVGAGLVLLVYLRLLDRAAVGIPLGVTGMVMTMPAVALSNTSVLTAMLSSGLAVGLLLLAFYPREDPLGAPSTAGTARREAATG
ncbi:hypothetical protein [uncultured Leifsonia sp.]|uniref:hypothetical protein n=1 Tax=uncultured Leifsonia sp. TaxID=340359 RepID=UPI0028D07165|nr:hypothetical protein [uncultured Leifsonia sp.]